MSRNMTVAEQVRFQGYFPAMDVDRQPRVTGEATDAYNCIAWTVGITNAWINPFQSLDEWDEFYAHFGLVRDNDGGSVAIWSNAGEYTHGCVDNAQDGFPWESKCGSDLRVLHELDELVNFAPDGYGSVEVYYRVPEVFQAPAPSQALTTPAPMNPQQNAARLQQLVQNVPSPLSQTFEALFSAWKDSWFKGELGCSSSTRDRAQGYAFQKLVAMGPDILPLVHQKLNDPQNFIAMELLDAIEPDRAARPRFAAADPAIKEGVQGRARRAVALYLSRQK